MTNLRQTVRPWEQRIQITFILFVLMLQHFFENILHIPVRIKVIRFCRLRDAEHDRARLSTFDCVYDAPVLLAYTEWAYRGFTEIIVEGNCAIIQEFTKLAFPVKDIVYRKRSF